VVWVFLFGTKKKIEALKTFGSFNFNKKKILANFNQSTGVSRQLFPIDNSFE
jgi:hypothetical protein